MNIAYDDQNLFRKVCSVELALDETHELPVTKVNKTLWNVLREVNKNDLSVVWLHRFVRKDWVGHYEALLKWLLWVVQPVVGFGLESGRKEVEEHVSCLGIFVHQ